MLHTYLLHLLTPPSLLPTSLLSLFSTPSLSLSTTLSTAERIATFLNATNTFTLLPSAPTTCAIYHLSIETTLGHSLSLSTTITLGTILGDRFGVKSSTVLSRRKGMMTLFAEWAGYLPWALLPTFPTDGRNLWTVGKMSAVVRYVPDVLQFQYEISARRGQQREHAITIASEEESEPPSRESPVAASTMATTAGAVEARWYSTLPHKRPRGSASAQRMITTLLQPSHPSSKLPPLAPGDTHSDMEERLARIELQVLYAPHLQMHHTLSRLGALALQRGGSESDHIRDEELFEVGELEGYLNADEEAALLGASHPEWDVPASANADNDHRHRGIGVQPRGRGRGRDQSEGQARKKSSGPRSKAEKVPMRISYSDEEDDPTYDDDETRHSWRVEQEEVDGEPSEDDDGDSSYYLGKEAYLGFGVFPGWDVDEPDTVRYFEKSMEEDG